MRIAIAFVGGLAVLGGAYAAEDAPLKPLADAMAFDGEALAKDPEKGDNVSGFDCAPTVGADRTCYIVDDEIAVAQPVTLTHQQGWLFHVGAPVTITDDALIKSGRGPTIAASDTQCPNRDDPDEFDGEAVAFDAGDFYIVGSQGCGRKKEKFRASTFDVARIAANGGVVLSHRLAFALKQAQGAVGQYFGLPLEDREKDGKILTRPDGLNVEGAGIIDGTLYAGLRAPVPEKSAAIVAVSLAALFKEGKSALDEAPQVSWVELGADTGIRDLEALTSPVAERNLLILSGPRIKGEFLAVKPTPVYALYLANAAGGQVTAPLKLATLEVAEGDVPEAIEVLDQTAQSIDVLVLCDGAPNGGPKIYRVPLRP